VHIVKDENLTWEQFNEAAPQMIMLMKENDWPDNRIDMHITFWSALQNHRWRHDFNVHKQRALLLYQAQQHRHWHLAIGSSNSWSLAKINQELLDEAQETIFNQFRMHQLSIQVCLMKLIQQHTLKQLSPSLLKPPTISTTIHTPLASCPNELYVDITFHDSCT
jgi:hypothetical protein